MVYDANMIGAGDEERSRGVTINVSDRRAMKFGSHYLPTYIPDLDGLLPEFCQKMFVRLEDLRA